MIKLTSSRIISLLTKNCGDRGAIQYCALLKYNRNIISSSLSSSSSSLSSSSSSQQSEKSINSITSSILSVNNENTSSSLSGFTNSRQGDWVCPNCGALSFSWRKSCYNCQTIKLTTVSTKGEVTNSSNKSMSLKSPNTLNVLEKKAQEIITPRRYKGKFNAKQTAKNEGIVLKELLQLSQSSKDYSFMLSAIDKQLSSKKQLKSSVVATILRAYGKSGNFDKAFDLFHQIGTNSLIRSRPTEYHYSAIITACADNGKWEEALQILDDMRSMRDSDDKSLKYRAPPNMVIYSAVMTACGKSNRFDKALQVFETILSERREDKGPPKDTVLFNQALHACCKLGKFKRAYELYEDMQKHKIKKDEVTYGTMLAICDEASDWVLANEIMKDIKYRKSVQFNLQMYSSVMGAFSKGGEAGKAIELFEDAKKTGLLLDAPLYSKALFALATLSKEKTEKELFIDGSQPTISTPANKFNNDDTENGEKVSNGVKALQLLSEMTKRNLRISQYALVQTIETLDSDKMYREAMSLYFKGEKNKVFESSVLTLKDKQRRLDLRYSSPAMVRVKVWCALERLLEEKAVDHDILFILGNNNKALLSFVVSILKNNIHAIENSSSTDTKSLSSQLRSIASQDGTLLRVPKGVLSSWMKTAAPSPKSTSGGGDSDTDRNNSENKMEKVVEADSKNNKSKKKKKMPSSSSSGSSSSESKMEEVKEAESKKIRNKEKKMRSSVSM